MGEIELEEIQAFFKIDDKIKRLKNIIKRLEIAFYDRSMTTRIENNGMEYYVVGERIENSVTKYVDSILEKENAIKILELRKRYLNKYLKSLPPSDAIYLTRKYSQKKLQTNIEEIDHQLYDEIQEINEAINHINGYPVEIESVEVDNDNLEDEFSQILEALEV